MGILEELARTARMHCSIEARRECPFSHKCKNVSVAADSECAEFIRAAMISRRRFIIGTGYSIPRDFERRFLCEPYKPPEWRKDNPMLMHHRQETADAVEAEYLRQERQAIQEECTP